MDAREGWGTAELLSASNLRVVWVLGDLLAWLIGICGTSLSIMLGASLAFQVRQDCSEPSVWSSRCYWDTATPRAQLPQVYLDSFVSSRDPLFPSRLSSSLWRSARCGYHWMTLHLHRSCQQGDRRVHTWRVLLSPMALIWRTVCWYDHGVILQASPPPSLPFLPLAYFSLPLSVPVYSTENNGTLFDTSSVIASYSIVCTHAKWLSENWTLGLVVVGECVNTREWISVLIRKGVRRRFWVWVVRQFFKIRVPFSISWTGWDSF